LIVTLVHVQIAILEVEWNFQPLALNRREQGGVDVEIDSVAKLVTFTRRRSFDAGRQVNGIVASGSALAKTAEQISKCFVTEKIQTFFRDFEMNVTRQRLRDFARSGPSALAFGALRLFFAEC